MKGAFLTSSVTKASFIAFHANAAKFDAVERFAELAEGIGCSLPNSRSHSP